MNILIHLSDTIFLRLPPILPTNVVNRTHMSILNRISDKKMNILIHLSDTIFIIFLRLPPIFPTNVVNRTHVIIDGGINEGAVLDTLFILFQN
jgi:hypothetical protein